MLYTNFNDTSSNTEITDSLTTREEAYLNSNEYQSIYREKNWIVAGAIMTWLIMILVGLSVSHH
jgi:hypothetical protein